MIEHFILDTYTFSTKVYNVYNVHSNYLSLFRISTKYPKIDSVDLHK